MEKIDLEKQVAKVVEDLFSQKKEADIRKNTETELKKAATSISELASELENKNDEVADLKTKLSDEATRVQDLTSELEAARKELETSNEKIGEVEATIEGMKKDRAEETRMSELEDAGVVNSNREAQSAKVREMTDDEFASYKGELVSIREAVIAELKKTSEKAEADAKAEEKDKEAAEKEAAEKEAAEKKAAEEAAAAKNGDETTIPVEIPPGEAVKASLNLENTADEGLIAKYAKLGTAMASRWAKSE